MPHLHIHPIVLLTVIVDKRTVVATTLTFKQTLHSICSSSTHNRVTVKVVESGKT